MRYSNTPALTLGARRGRMTYGKPAVAAKPLPMTIANLTARWSSRA